MNIEQMRLFVSEAYKGDSWKTRVKSMSDEQVIAIYCSLKKRGR